MKRFIVEVFKKCAHKMLFFNKKKLERFTSFNIVISQNTCKKLLLTDNWRKNWKLMVINFTSCRVWISYLGMYRDSPVSAVSISAVFDLVRFTNSTKQH